MLATVPAVGYVRLWGGGVLICCRYGQETILFDRYSWGIDAGRSETSDLGFVCQGQKGARGCSGGGDEGVNARKVGEPGRAGVELVEGAWMLVWVPPYPSGEGRAVKVGCLSWLVWLESAVEARERSESVGEACVNHAA
jgi:hypothetical protein